MSISPFTHQSIYVEDPTLALWNVLAGPTIDPATLPRAIETVLNQPNLDWRTFQLAKEGWTALEDSVEPSLLNDFLQDRTASELTEHLQSRSVDEPMSHGEVKFPSLKGRLMPHLSPITIRQFLRELGSAIARPTTITMGGAASLILRGLLFRATEDVNIVDEVPAEIRHERQVLEDLSDRYGLHMTHFQSHYLPRGWEARTTDVGTLGKIHVRLVDVVDIVLEEFSRPGPKTWMISACCP
jgi:hypothetical protein